MRGSSVRVCLVVLYQGCCGSGQYNLPDRMLRLNANTTLNQSYALFITLVNITYLSMVDVIYPMVDVIYPIVLGGFLCFLTVCRVVLVFFKCMINLTSFLFKSRFISSLLFIHFVYFLIFFLIKQLFSHETVKVSRLFCFFVLFLELKL